MSITPGAPLGRSLMSPAKRTEMNQTSIDRRVSNIERTLMGFSEVDITTLDLRRYKVLAKNSGTIIEDETSIALCALGSLEVDPDNNEAFIITPGYITGGGSSIFLEKAGIEPTEGHSLYIEVSWTGEKEDGILLDGGVMTAAEVKQSATLPDDEEPTVSDLNGKHYIPLGNWNEDLELQGATCGNAGVAFCSGNFKSVRG